MSTRILKRFNKSQDDFLALKPDQSESEEEELGLGINPKKQVKNRFELLTDGECSQSDTEVKDDKDSERLADTLQTNLEASPVGNNSDGLKSKKKKKKKKLKAQKSVEDVVDHNDEDIDAAIKEVKEMYQEADQLASFTAQSTALSKKPQKSLLSADFRYLNYANEVRKIFGHEVMQAEQHKKRGRGRSHTRQSCLISPKNWSHLINNGLKMECERNKDNVYYFSFEHSKQYQLVQQNFLKVVEMGDPSQIEALIQAHPSNLDLMIQFSEICMVVESFQMAAELIEMGLYVAEMSFHPLFNLVQGNCRLDYTRSTNRSFYVALFKHIILIGQKNFNRTALELCKALLGLNPDEDPLGVILMIDYFAIKSGEHEYLLQIFNEWNKAKNLIFLPNFAYSVPLAMYHNAKASEQADNVAKATDMLINAINRFPEVIVPLLTACKADATSSNIVCHPFFTPKNKAEYPDGLRMLTELYVARTVTLWKEADVLQWLISTINSVLSSATPSETLPADYKQKRSAAYSGTVRSVLRHISLSNLKEVTLALPSELTNNVIYSFDPFPPENSVDLYRRPTPTTRQTGYISTFIRSLVPTYTVEQEDNRAEAEGANGEEESTPEQLRRHLTSLLDVIRELLNNIQVIDGDVESDAEE